MVIRFFYNNSAVTLSIWSAFLFFFLFLVYAIVTRLSAGNDTYRKLNRTHKQFFIAYLVLSISYGLYTANFNKVLGISLMVGSFIFYSLHYVFLFALVGLVKKSISINILMCLWDLEMASTRVDVSTLSKHMDDKKLGFASIREDRLEQMALLGFAEKNGPMMKINPKGKLVNETGRIILRIWNLARL